MQLPPFAHASVLVIGDVMLDRYWQGGTNRISPEAPVPVVKIGETHDRPGGAGNVALNLAALQAKTQLIGLIGEDEEGSSLNHQLQAASVDCHLHTTPTHPTITKLRVLSLNQQLIRLDFEQNLNSAPKEDLLDDFHIHLPAARALILSDYHKGTLQEPAKLIQAANQLSIPVLVDPKGESFEKYRGATLLTPNRKEFELVVGKCNDNAEIVKRGLQAIDDFQLQALLVTRGAEGMTLLQKGKLPLHLPAKAQQVYDVTGAGDTVIATLAAAIAAGADLADATRLANTAASIAVSKLGAATITVPELRRALRQQQKSDLGILTEEEALLAVQDARAHGEKVVMTNGCFDVLHPGHIAYLDEAKSLGDRLLIAVNDDASVARLKGDSRPINTLASRMAVLAGLRAADWVVSFSADTPQALIAKMMPDVLVKGGDYQVQDIAGAEDVLAAGGEVRILSFLPGHSTSEIIQKIKEDSLA